MLLSQRMMQGVGASCAEMAVLRVAASCPSCNRALCCTCSSLSGHYASALLLLSSAVPSERSTWDTSVSHLPEGNEHIPQ